MTTKKTLAIIAAAGIGLFLLAEKSKAAICSPHITCEIDSNGNNTGWKIDGCGSRQYDPTTCPLPIVLPIQSSCSLPQNVLAGQDGSATVTVLAGNVAKNAVFSIQKAGVECSRTSTVAIPGDLATHTYPVTIPVSGCLGSIAGSTAEYNISMILL
jgi:hypothetical protein